MIGVKKLQQSWPISVSVTMFVLVVLILSSCQLSTSIRNGPIQTASADAEIHQETTVVNAHGNQGPRSNEGHRAELDQKSPIELNPSKGQEIGAVYEAFLSPHQEGGEEEDTPELTPEQFRSTAPSVSRNNRQSHGHGVLAFTNDLSKAFVHVAIEGVKPEDVVMFHIHCGRPGQLGPIIVDFGLAGDLQEYWADDIFALEVTNEDIVAAASHGEGLVAAFTSGCPIIPAVPTDKVKTIGGLELIARQGELYFNLHTKGQTFFGDIRGQLYQVER